MRVAALTGASLCRYKDARPARELADRDLRNVSESVASRTRFELVLPP